MITADLFKKDEMIVTIGDYKQECPKGKTAYFGFIHFTDESTCLWANIFASKRASTMKQVMKKFGDSLEYITSINLHESQN